jgi:hypothetical protein
VESRRLRVTVMCGESARPGVKCVFDLYHLLSLIEDEDIKAHVRAGSPKKR